MQIPVEFLTLECMYTVIWNMCDTEVECFQKKADILVESKGNTLEKGRKYVVLEEQPAVLVGRDDR